MLLSVNGRKKLTVFSCFITSSPRRCIFTSYLRHYTATAKRVNGPWKSDTTGTRDGKGSQPCSKANFWKIESPIKQTSKDTVQNTSAKRQANYQITSNRNISNYMCKTFMLKIKQGKKRNYKTMFKAPEGEERTGKMGVAGYCTHEQCDHPPQDPQHAHGHTWRCRSSQAYLQLWPAISEVPSTRGMS